MKNIIINTAILVMLVTYLFAKDDYMHLLLDFATISISFFLLTNLVWIYYKNVLSKNKNNLALRFLSINMPKDVFWVVSFAYYFKSEYVLILYLMVVFIFGSVPLYVLVIRDLNKVDPNSDKNQL